MSSLSTSPRAAATDRSTTFRGLTQESARPSALKARSWGALLCAFALSFGAHAEDLIIPGSGNPEYVLGQLADAFNRAQTRHRVTVPPSSGTAGALRDVESGAATLGRVGRPLKPEETRRGLIYIPLGRDPVVFVAGAEVSARNVTTSQMIDVYAGKITDWRDLGGKPAPIRAIGREANDASRAVINQRIPAFQNIAFGRDVKMVHLDPHVIMLLDRFPSALAFINRSATKAAKTRVVPLALDAMEPTAENVESGRYPLVLEFGLVHKASGLSEAGKAFVDYLRAAEAHQFLRAHGVSPLLPRAQVAGR